MPRTKIQLFLIIVFFNILYLKSVRTQEEYAGNCKNPDAKQSPINIIPPFTFTSFNGEFQFNTLFEGFLENNNHTLKLEGDFGSILHGNKVYNTYEINFKSPSEHTIGEDNITLPLEIQISSISEDNSRVNLAILFSKDDEDSSFLYTLGFGKGLLQHLKPAQFLEFKGSFSLKEILPQENNFFMYQGSSTSTPCSPAVWLIAYNTFRISQRQIDDFPRSLVYKRREIQDQKKREIFITFYPGLEKKTETKTNATNQTKNTSNDTNASKTNVIVSNENDKFIDGQDEIISKIQNKDSFKILGDSTNYDFDFYGGETAIKNRGIKYIRNEDYLVVYDKEYIKEMDSSTSITIDDKVVDEIIDSLERKNNKTNCLKQNNSKNETNITTNTNQSSNNIETSSSASDYNNVSSNKNVSNPANFFEKDMLDLWTVEKITKNLQIPTESIETKDEFTFKKPEKNKIFLNLNQPTSFLQFNKPISFLQVNQQSDVSQSANPFFVITEDMIKNSQNNPIIIDSNTLQNLISVSNSNSNPTSDSNPSKKEEIIQEKNTKIEKTNGSQTDLTAFVQTKLEGIIKERISEEDFDSKLQNSFNSENLKNAKEITFDGYLPNEENEDISQQNNKNDDSNSKTGLYSLDSNSDSKENVNLDDSFKDKTPEEIKELKEKMKKILNYLDDKLRDTKKIVNTNTDDSSKYSDIKEKVSKNLEKSQSLSKKIQETTISSSKTTDSPSTARESHSKTESSSITESSSKNDDLSTILDSPNDEDPLKILKKIAATAQENNDFPCQGKLAKDRSGKWDGISILNISTWPDKCKFGSYQSPLHIGLNETFFVEPHLVNVDYGKPDNNKIEIYNDGYKLIVKGMFGSIKYGDHELPTKEIYIHHPSEHTFGEDQSRTDFEVQILHEDKAGAKVIVSVFLHNTGGEEDNGFLEDLGFIKENKDQWFEFTDKKSVINQKIDLSSLVNAIPHFITYDGSLTTPPCTEGVKWIILRKRKKVSQKQIKAFQYLFGKESNIRGTQDLGYRKLKIF